MEKGHHPVMISVNWGTYIGQALGISTEWSNHPLHSPGGLELLDGPEPEKILVGPRVGIDYALPEHVSAPWRFAIAVCNNQIMANLYDDYSLNNNQIIHMPARIILRYCDETTVFIARNYVMFIAAKLKVQPSQPTTSKYQMSGLKKQADAKPNHISKC
uniref:DNA-3-methyladenine glycosylase II n=1 Tax=Salix viminalis TaxID=40686 RepID=A0A6N2NJK0_SALVM